MIDEKRLIDELENWSKLDKEMSEIVMLVIDTLKKMIEKQPRINEWIRFELDEDGILVSPIPDDEQEILISDGDSVWFDTFINDLGECYLDSNIELIGLAWMPLPEPYGGNENEQN